MLKAPFPTNEAARLRGLRAPRILDTPAKERFDRVTRIAQHILRVPIVLERDYDEIVRIAVQQGFQDLRYDGFKKPLRGVNSPDEVICATVSPEGGC